MLTLERISTIEDYSPYLQTMTPTQLIYSFPNGYGASIINNQYSYGIELAVLKINQWERQIVYDTAITDDVVPYIQDIKEIKQILKSIQAL